jgi:hypothetical protein
MDIRRNFMVEILDDAFCESFTIYYPRIAFAFGASPSLQMKIAAAAMDDVDLLSKIIKLGNIKKNRLIYTACLLNNSKKCLKYLLDNNIAFKDELGKMLELAIVHENSELMAMYSHMMSSPKFLNSSGSIIAARHGKLDCLKSILNSEKPPSWLDDVDAMSRLLNCAIRHRQFECAKFIASKITIMQKFIYHELVMCSTATYGRFDCLKYIVERHELSIYELIKIYKLALVYSFNDKHLINYLAEKIRIHSF